MKQKKISIYALLLLVLLLPWFNSNYLDSVNLKSADSGKVDIFFQINPCKVSFFEYVAFSEDISKVNFSTDDSSPIYCFGRISQYKIIDGNINVYIGTNFFVNILINSFLIVLLIKLISKDNDMFNRASVKPILLTSILISLLIFSDRKFYKANFYLLDITSFNTYLFIFCFIFILLFFINDNINIKNKYLLNYFPFLFLFSKNISQTNISIFLIYFVLVGAQADKPTKSYVVIRNIYIFGLIFWAINARIPYIDYPDNYLGFTSTSYDFYSIAFYSFMFYFLLKGLFYFKIYGFKEISLDKIMKNLYWVFCLKILIYFLSSFTLTNFIFSNYFEIVGDALEKVTLYNFIDSNLDFLILLLFFSIIKLIIDKNKMKINFFSIFYLFLVVINTTNLYKILNSNLKDSTLKFFEFYNPTFLELLIGSGPLNFNQFNFEINSDYTFNFFSTLASFLIFFGVAGLTISFIYLIKLNFIYSRVFFIQLLYLFYLIFSEVVNDLSSIVNYYLLFLILFNKELRLKLHQRQVE